jgi:GAF domain-containing protein
MSEFSPTPIREPEPIQAIPSAWARLVDLLTGAHASLTDVGDQKRARLTAGLVIVITLTSLLGTIFGQDSSRPYQLGLIGLSSLAYILSRTRYYRIGAFVFLIALSASPYISILINNDRVITRLYAWLPLALVIASALVNRWYLFLLTGILAAATVSLIALYPEQSQEISAASGVITSLGVLLIYLESFRLGIEKQRLEELTRANRELSVVSQFLEERVAERTAQLDRKTSQLEAASMVARTAAETTNLRTLLDNVAEQIASRFGFYHVGVYLSDNTRQKLYLVAASAGGGQQLLARGFSLNIGREGLIANAAYDKRPRVSQDTERENVFLRINDLPDTRSEAALPLLIKNQVIGVLDIQSSEQNQFGPEDLFVLQTMADQIALAIQNARLLEESQAALEQLQVISSQSIQDAWRNYLKKGKLGFIYRAGSVEELSETPKNVPVVETRNLDVDIKLRGQKIGTITLKRSATETDWTEKEHEFTAKVADQIALAVENARLLEDSQRRAAREETLNELSNRLSRSLDLETLLQNAVMELHKLPMVTNAAVMIAPEELRPKK